MRNVLRPGLALAMLGLSASPASGAVSGNFSVLANVASSCQIVGSIADLDFGSYDPLGGSAKTGQTAINVRCSLLLPYTVKLNAGQHSGNDFSARRMQNQSDETHYLSYNLYTLAGCGPANLWGDGTATTTTVGGIGSGLLSGITPASHTVYGCMPAGQEALPGSYSDTVTVTITY